MESPTSEGLAGREQKIANDKIAKFKGAARISIKHLEFPHPTRQIDKKAIRQLVRDFDAEGCIREEPSHRIPAIIDNSILQAALEKISLTAEAFRAKVDDPPILKLGNGVKLECLHGQHRILAAKEYLNAPMWWWTVDIYGTDLNKGTKQALREGYSYSSKYKSGEIFRHMRLCHYDNDLLGAQRWRGRFSPSQDKFLEQLLKRPILMTALDSVLHIRGIWSEFYIGSLDVFLFPRCDEEIAHYIKSTKDVLAYIFNNDMATMMQTDPMSIESIQSRSPALSKSDYEFIQRQMRSGELFPQVVNPLERAHITQRLLATQELITSLYTLIKDIRYLKQPAELLSKFLPDCRKKTLRQRWLHYFSPTNDNDEVEIQQKVSGPLFTISSAHLDSFDISYQQLWLCSYRVCKYSNAYGRLQLAELAQRLGFSTPKIEFELSQDPAQDIIEKTFREIFHILRPNEKYNFDVKEAGHVITALKRYLQMLETLPIDTRLPSVTVSGEGTPLSCRCGHGQMDTRDLAHLFLDQIHAPLLAYKRDGDEISSFYVKRSRHLNFFGAIDLARHQESSSTHPVPVSASSNHRQLEVSPPVSASSNHRQLEVSPPVGASSNHRQPEVSPPAEEHSSPIPSFNDQAYSLAKVIGSNHIIEHKERVVKFVKKDVILQEVPFREEAVNIQAKEYADQGNKLYVEQGPYFVWQHCFDILIKTGKSVVIVNTVVEPVIGKRNRDEDLPERLQPATKEAYDFDMNDDEEEF